MPTDKELAMQRKQDELQQQQQAEAAAALATQPPSLGRELTPKEQSMANMSQQLQTPDVTTEKPKYTPLYDWSTGMTMKDAYNQGKHTRDEIWIDRDRWGRENNNPANIMEAYDMIPETHDGTKTKVENEEDEKKLKAKERLDRFGNFLQHLGNFIGAVGYGAPSQTIEPARELTDRQKKVRDETQALRTAYNNRFFENYWKQRAEESSQDRLTITKQQQDRLDADLRLRTDKYELDKQIKNGTLDLKEKELALKREVAKGRLSQGAAKIYLDELKYKLAKAKEERLAGGTEKTVEKETDTPFGKQKEKSTTVTKPASKPTTRTAPPSRQRSASSNNTPPSRRKK